MRMASWRAHLKDLLTFLWRDTETRSSKTQVSLDEQQQPTTPEAASPAWEFNSLFNQVLERWDQFFPGWLRPSGWNASIDTTWENDKLHFKVTLPGFRPQDVEVLLVGNQLVIKGQRSIAQEQNFRFSFMNARRFERTLRLPEGVSPDQVNARYHDGVLEISLPAPQSMKVRRIPIEVK
jgi:HSP20 family protein